MLGLKLNHVRKRVSPELNFRIHGTHVACRANVLVATPVATNTEAYHVHKIYCDDDGDLIGYLGDFPRI